TTLERDPDGSRRLHRRLARQQVRKVISFEHFHDEVALSGRCFSEIGYVDDVLVANTRCAPCFLVKTLHDLWPTRKIIAEHLEGYTFFDHHMLRFIDDAHPAFPDLAQDPIPISKNHTDHGVGWLRWRGV